MGPRSFKRGNTASVSEPPLNNELQWGHALLSVETGDNDMDILSYQNGFNGATLF